MNREKKLIAVSLLLGLAAAAGFYLFSSGNSPFGKADKVKKEEPRLNTVRCAVAAQDIRNREKITAEMIVMAEVPETFAHPDAVRDEKDAIGGITRDRIIRGELILKQNLREKNAPSELSFILPANKRAITIEASVTGSVGYMVKPGDRVDIILYMNGDNKGEDVSFTLLANMLVLATDMKIYGDEEDKGVLDKASGSGGGNAIYQSITVAASPEECVKLSLSESVGRLKLALHSPLDDKPASGAVTMASMKDLRRIAGMETVVEKKKEEKVAAAPRRTGNRTTVEVWPDKSLSALPVMETPEKKEEVRNVYIIRGTELDVVSARTSGAAKNVKRGEVK